MESVHIDSSRLLGFETVPVDGVVDFRDSAFAAQAGAKVGIGEAG